MTRSFFTPLLLAALITTPALSEPFEDIQPAPIAPATLPELDFGDALEADTLDGISGLDDLSGAPSMPDEDFATPVPAYTPPPEALAPMRALATHVITTLQANDPDRLSSLPAGLQSRIPDIVSGNAQLAPEDLIPVMKLYSTLAEEGYQIDLSTMAAPLMAPQPDPLPLPTPLPTLPAIPVIPDPPVPPAYIPEYEVYAPVERRAPEETYYESDLADLPRFATVSEGSDGDHRFNRFFPLSFSDGAYQRRLELTVTRGGLFTPQSLSNPAESGYVQFSLYAEDGNRWYPNSSSVIDLAPGTYDLVTRIVEPVDTDITLRLKLTPSLDRTEPNDTRELATEISLPFRRHLFLEAENDVDWLTFILPVEGVLSAAIRDGYLSLYNEDGKNLPLGDASSGTRYLIADPGTYFVEVSGYAGKSTSKVTLRHYPPSEIGAEINRIIGVGLEDNEETRRQMEAVSYVTGAPLVTTNNVEEISTALAEASGQRDGLSWIWYLLGLVVFGGGAYVFLRQKMNR